MQELRFDFNNMLSHNIGKRHGVTDDELERVARTTSKAHRHLRRLINHPGNRVNLGLEWTNLPFQDRDSIGKIQRVGQEISEKYENVIFLGIGGSYLGLKAAQDALCAPYYNEFPSLRKGRPRIYFEGNNLDPDTLGVLCENLEPKKTFVVAISKSGETTETNVALAVVESWLKKGAGEKYTHQVIAITDPKSGSLRGRVEEEQKRDTQIYCRLVCPASG